MNLQDVLTALERADAAGDTQSARELAQLAQSMSARPQSRFAQERANLERQLQEVKSRKIVPEQTFGGNVKEAFKGVIPGAVGLLETAGVGAAALLPEETERAAREGISSLATAAKRPFEAAPGYEESVGRKIGEGLGSIVPMAPLGLLGAPGVIGGIGVGLAAGAGEARQAAEAKRATEGERGAATALGTIPGAFDAIVDMSLAAFPGGAGKAIGFIRRALISGGTEGATEAAQQIAQNAIAKGIYDPTQQLLTGSGEAAGYGAGVGALASVIFDIAIPGRRAGAAAPPPAAPPPAAATPPATTPAAPPAAAAPSTTAPAPAGIASLVPPPAAGEAPTLTAPAQNKYVGFAEDLAELSRNEERPDDSVEMYRQQLQDELEAGNVTDEATVNAAMAAFDKRIADLKAQETAALTAGAPAPSGEATVAQQVTEAIGATPPSTENIPSYTITYPDGSQIVGFGTPPTNLPAGATVSVEPAKQKTAESKPIEQARLEAIAPLVQQSVTLPEMTLPQLEQNVTAELARQGFENPNLTETERSLLNLAFGVQQQQEAATTEAGAEGTVATEEKPTATEEKPTATEEKPAEAAAPAAPASTVLTPEVLTEAGLSNRSAYFKQLSNLDMANPEQQATALGIFQKMRGNTEKTKAAAANLIARMQGNESTRPTAATTGTSTEGGKGTERKGAPGAPAADTGATEASKPSGLGTTGKPTGKSGTTKGGKPASVKEVKTEEGKPTETPTQILARVRAEKKAKEEADKKAAEEAAAKKKADEEAEAKKKADEEAEAKSTAISNAETAFDQVGEYESLDEALDSYRINTNDSLRDKGIKDPAILRLAAEAFDQRAAELRKADAETKAVTTAKEMAAEAFAQVKKFSGINYAIEAYRNNLNDALKDRHGITDPKVVQLAKIQFDERVKELRRKPKKKTAAEEKAEADEKIKAAGRKAYSIDLSLADNPYMVEGRPDKNRKAEFELWKQGWIEAEEAGSNPFFLPKDAVRIFTPLHEEVVAKLKAGDLSGALETAASRLSGRDAAIARALAKVLKGVKVSVNKDLKSPKGRILSGEYDLATDTVMFDEKEGMNLHTLLHESTHAAIEKILSNPSHPVSKQLNDLFNNVKDSLGTAYGYRNVSEFVAEAMSNPEFQQLLSQIDISGKQISAWTRFTNAVANMLRALIGAPTKGVGSTLDAVDSLVATVVAPNANSVGVGSLYQASLLGTIKDVFKTLDKAIISMPGFDNEFVDRAYNLLSTDAPDFVKRTVLQGLPLEALVKVAKKAIPMAERLSIIEHNLNGELDKRREAIDGTIQRIQRWVKGNPEKEAILNRVIKESTLNEVDPSKPVTYYVNEYTKDNENKQDIWNKLQADWKLLEDEGQAVYKQMRDTYAESYNDLLSLLFKRVDASVADPEDAKKIRTELQKQFTIKGKIEPYFPLMREGDYWLTYSTTNGEFYKMAFKTRTERARAMELLKTEPTVDAKSVKESLATSKFTFKDAPPTAFVNNVIKTLGADPKVPKESIEEIMRIYLDTLPETSFAQAFRKRLGTLGFEENAVDVFYKKSITMAHQLGTMKYSNQLFALRDEMRDFIKERNNTKEAQELFNVMDRHIATIVSPKIAPLSKALTSATFGMTLGANVSSVMVNFAQMPLVIMPYLGGQYGYAETTSAIGFANSIFFGSGRNRKVKMSGISAEERKLGKDIIEVKAGYSMDNYDYDALAERVKKGETLSKREQDILEMRELSDLAKNRGLLTRSIASDVLDMNEQDSVLSKVNNYMGFMFHHGERMTRQISLMASYKLELDSLRKAGKDITPAVRQAAAEKAIQLTELMNGGASANSAPLLAKNSIGKIMFMYKRYGVSMYYMLYQTAREALKSENEQVRAAAKRQLVGIYGMSALLAGVQGMPMFGVAAALYNLILKEDDEDDFETLMRKYMGEGMFSGALNYLTGTAIAQRIGLSDLLLRDTGYRNEDNKLLSLMQLVGGPVYGTADRLGRAAKLVSEGETQRGLEQAAPAALSNLMKAYRYANEGTMTLRGDPITGEVSAGNIGAQALGFAPADYTLQLEINSNVKGIERAVTEKRTKLLKQYYIATRNGDSDEASDIFDELLKMNERHPGILKPDTIKKSMKQHAKTSAEMYHGVTLNKIMRRELMNNADEYDKNTSIWGDE